MAHAIVQNRWWQRSHAFVAGSNPFCCSAGVEASSCTGAADPFAPSLSNPPFESEEAAVDSNGEFPYSVHVFGTCPDADNKVNLVCVSDLQFLFSSYAGFLKYATSAANGSCLYCLKYVEASETHLMKRHYLKAVHFILDGTGMFIKEHLNHQKRWGLYYYNLGSNYSFNLFRKLCCPMCLQSQDPSQRQESLALPFMQEDHI